MLLWGVLEILDKFVYALKVYLPKTSKQPCKQIFCGESWMRENFNDQAPFDLSAVSQREGPDQFILIASLYFC